MKFLVDVNISKSKKFLKDHPNLLNVIDEIDGKVSDKKLIKYAKEHELGIYTQDKECALYALIAEVTVWYRDQKTNESYKLKAQTIAKTKKEKEDRM